MKIEWSDRSLRDLSEIREYIADDSEDAAIRVLEQLIGAAETLDSLPERGRRVPEAPDFPELRELLVGNYRLVYRRRDRLIEVVLVIHGRRDLSAQLTGI